MPQRFHGLKFASGQVGRRAEFRTSSRAKFPAIRQFNKFGRVRRPVVQGGGVKIRAVRPDDGADFRVNANLAEKNRVAQRTEKLPAQNRLEVDGLRRAVFKLQVQRMRRDHRDAGYEMDVMHLHVDNLHISAQRRNRQRQFARLQPPPVGLQFLLVQFRPRLDQPRLTTRQ